MTIADRRGSARLPSRSARGAIALLCAAASLVLTSERTAAQVYRIDAGSSSLFDAHGGTLEVRTGSSTVRLSAGGLQSGLTAGALFQHRRRHLTFGAGDDVVDFNLPSDLFGGSHNVVVRGVRVDHRREPWRVTTFAGMTSTSVGAPFFRGGTWDRPLGLVFVDRALTPRWRFVSKNAFSTRQTSIHALEWHHGKALSFAAAGGVGNNQPYASISGRLDRGWLIAKAAYVTRPGAFRRLEIDSPMAAEVERENAAIAIRRTRWSVNAARQHFFQDETGGRAAAGVAVNQAGAGLNVGGLRLSSALFDSRSADRSSIGSAWTIGRQLTGRFDASLDYFRHEPDDGPATGSTVLTVRTTVHPRLSLLHVLNRAGGQTSLNMGGEFLSNPLRVSVSYQTIYAPLRTEDPFVQFMGVDFRINGPLGWELGAGTFATPDGRVRYTVSIRQIMSRFGSRQARGGGLHKYRVRGRVVDPEGRPIEGAVLQIGRDIVITDQDGQFLFRTPTAARLAVQVMLDEFIAPGTFEVVSVPATLTPRADDGGPVPQVVLRRR